MNTGLLFSMSEPFTIIKKSHTYKKENLYSSITAVLEIVKLWQSKWFQFKFWSIKLKEMLIFPLANQYQYQLVGCITLKKQVINLHAPKYIHLSGESKIYWPLLQTALLNHTPFVSQTTHLWYKNNWSRLKISHSSN